MSHAPQQLSRLVDVLDQRVERLTRTAAEAAAAVTQIEKQIQRLADMSAAVALPPLACALHRANAAEFRNNLMRVAQSCQDELGTREARQAAARAELLAAARQHKVMSMVRERALERETLRLEKAEQKRQDELASQTWLRAALRR